MRQLAEELGSVSPVCKIRRDPLHFRRMGGVASTWPAA